MKKRGNFFKTYLISSTVILQLVISPLAHAAEPKTQAFFNSERQDISAPSPYKSDKERLDVKKLKQHGVDTKNAELLPKIEQAKNNTNEKIKGDPLFKKIKEDKLKQKTEIENLSQSRIDTLLSNPKKEKEDKLKDRKSEIIQLIQESEEIIEKTKKKKENFDDLREINKKLQQTLDSELDILLTPEERAEVGEVEANFLYALEGEDTYPNDTEINNQWEISSVYSQFNTHFDLEASTTERGVVAIIDTGVDYTHEDLVGHFYNPATCFDETGTTTPNGCPYGGWDYVDDDNDPMPQVGETHGTNIAGIVGAQSGSNLGIASLSNNLVDIMPIRVTDGNYIELDNIIDAIYFAVENGADVINMSFTGPTYSETLKTAIEYAEQNDVIVVAAAGNYGTDIDNTPSYPASYDLSNVVAVGALNVDHTMASFSNFGDQTVDFAAPGVDLVTTNNNNSYKKVTGSSFSAALASAMTGALLAQGQDPLAVFATLDESPTLVQRTVNGRVLGAAVDLPPTIPRPAPDLSATATDPYFGEYYINLPGGVSTASSGAEYSLEALSKTLDSPDTISPGGLSHNYIEITDLTPTFRWHSVPGAQSYGLYLFDVTANKFVTLQFNLTGSRFTLTEALVPGRSYRWNMAAYESNGDASHVSDFRFFRIASDKPLPPDTYSPGLTTTPGPADPSTSRTFTWQDVGSDSYTLTLINRNTNKSSRYEDISSDSETVNNLTLGHSYSWYIQACDNVNGCGDDSYSRYFRVLDDNSAPSVPGFYGNSTVEEGVAYDLTLYHYWDTDGDAVSFEVKWGDGITTNSGSYVSENTPLVMSHTYTTSDTYCIEARSYDGEDFSPYGSCKNVEVTEEVTSADLVGEIQMTDSSLTASDYTTVNFDVLNIGGSSVTNDFKIDFYISSDRFISPATDQWVGTYDVTSDINAGGEVSGNKTFAIPDAGHLSYDHDGQYYIGMVVDAQSEISEASEANNVGRGVGIDIGSLYINGTQAGELQFNINNIGTTTAGEEFSVTVQTSPPTFTGRVQVTAEHGEVSKQFIDIVDGSGQESLYISSPGMNRLTVSKDGVVGVSNDFNNTSLNIEGEVTIKVTDKRGESLSGVPVTISCVSVQTVCLTVPETKNSDVNGLVSFTGKYAGTYKINLNYNGNPAEKEINVSSVINSFNLFSVAVSTADNHNPVILVPGIGGSTDRFVYNFKFEKPFGLAPVITTPLEPNADNSSKLKIVDRSDSLSNGLSAGWSRIRKILEDDFGYSDGSLIDCPWDWRKTAYDAAKQYLAKCIKEAQNGNPNQKVDIVAHSMGGLVARAYVQGGNYRGEVEKIAFMGTPHEGGSNAYPLWMGRPAENIHREMVINQIDAYDYNELGNFNRSLSEAGLAYQNSTTQILSQNPEEKVWNKEYTKNFIRSQVKSIKDLLPTYPFLVISSGSDKRLYFNENKFLLALNAQDCMNGACGYGFVSPDERFGTANGKVESKTFMNSAIDYTPYKFYLSGVPKSGEDGDIITHNIDGTAVQSPTGSGDGTVITRSSSWLVNGSGAATADLYDLKYEKSDVSKDAKHGVLMAYLPYNIGEFLTGLTPTLSSYELEGILDNNPFLSLSLDASLQPVLTTPDGFRFGIESDGGVVGADQDSTVFEISESGSYFGLESPREGQYTLELHNAEATDFDFSIAYGSDERSESYSYTAIYDGSTTTITFNLNSAVASENPVLTFSSVLDHPENLIATNQAGYTLLSWSTPEKGSPTAYNIYSRPVNNSTLEFQTQVSTTTYTTSDTWAGADKDLMKRYQVTAVYSNGEESFLSNTVYNNDEDQDGLPDHLEVEEGTSTSTPDTDGDGLTDGEEYFNYGTDPTLSDTDGDGISDYDEVTPGGTGSTTVAVASQIYQDGLENGWAEYGSYGSTVNYESTTEVAEGTTAIEIDTDGTWSGMWLRNNNNFNTTGYNSLKFAYHPGNVTNHTPVVRFYDENHEATFGDDISITDYITENISGGLESKWYNVAIPLTDIEIVNEVVSDLVLITSNTATFYIDNLHFSTDTIETGSDTVVYNNALQNSWSESGSWSVTTDFSDTGTTYASSSSAIELSFNTTWAGMALTTASVVEGSEYENMHIAYNPGSEGGQTDYIKLRNASSSDLTANYIPFSNYITGTPQTNTWYSLNIPLTDLGASTSTIKDMIILGSASTTIYLDELRFTSTVATSSGTSTPTGAVYTEALDSPWQFDGDWRATTTFDSATANNGSYGIEMDFEDPWAGSTLSASTSVDTSGFGLLNLAYNPGATTSQTMFIKLQDPSAVDYSTFVPLSDYITGSQIANTWYELSVPFSDLGLTAGDLVKKIDFTTSATSTVYFDDIAFVASSTPQSTTTDPTSTNQSVFTDSFQNTWTHGGSWLATTTYTSATNTTGYYGIETIFTAGQWSDSAFEAGTPIDTTNLEELNLSYNPGATTSHSVLMKTKDETGTDHGSSISLGNYVTNLVANTWHNLSIPLIDLGVTAGELIKNIIFMSNDGPKVYFDDVYFGEPNTGGDNSFTEGMVSLSFDDGWLDHYTEALPILDAEGIDGTFYITSEESLQATNLPQLILNPSLETDTAGTPDNWHFNSWGTNDATSTYPVAGVDGNDAARVDMTSYTDGDAKWYFDDVDVYQGNAYTISYQYRSDITTDLVMRYTMQDDSHVYVTATTSPASTAWATTTVVVTTPENVKSLTALPVIAGVGYLEVDNFKVNRNQIYVDPTQVLALESSGHEIGSHTRHHPSLTQISSSQQQDEINNSKADLLNVAKIGVTSVTTLAYPYGDYDTNVQSITAGSYTAGRSVDRGFNHTNTNKYALKIQQVDRTTTITDIQNWIQTAKQDKTWLILMFHQINDNSAHTLGITPELLEDIAEYIALDGISTVTVAEGVGLMD